MRFLPGTSNLVAGDLKGNLHIWDVDTGIELLNIPGSSSPINRVACSPDGKTICTVSHDGTVSLWFGEEENGLNAGRPASVSNAIDR